MEENTTLGNAELLILSSVVNSSAAGTFSLRPKGSDLIPHVRGLDLTRVREG